ncbi:Crp/Fnr family transcriptional regulator [Clostridia bacterium]|nr:Crp/Fnr family transcriptional regulator [Clostridia bacterium]
MEQQTFLPGLNYMPLPNEAEGIFESFKSERRYKKNTMIYNQGETATSFYYLKKGQVKIFFNSPEGLEKTLSVVSSSTILGEAAFFDELPRVSSAKTITDCIIISINRQELLNKFREKPNLAFHLLTLQARSVRMLSAHVSSITFLKADCRIAAVLLQAAIQKNGKLVVELTHEEIGNMVGVSRVTVSKILNALDKKGIITTAYKSIIILNEEKLQEITA